MDSANCPITLERFKDPVMLVADGHTYERAALERWLMRSDLSPATGSRLFGDHRTKSNYCVRKLLAELLDEQKGCPSSTIQPEEQHGWALRELPACSRFGLAIALMLRFADVSDVSEMSSASETSGARLAACGMICCLAVFVSDDASVLVACMLLGSVCFYSGVVAAPPEPAGAAVPVLALSRILLFTGMLLCLLGLYLMRSSGETASADVATSNQRAHEPTCTEELPRRQGFARALPEVWRVTQVLQPRPVWRR